MGIPVQVETFACMAEARAHYYKQGYTTLSNTANGDHYVLVKDVPGQRLSPMVRLIKTGFLRVEVEHV
jgi:hypothetical protein